MEVLLLEPEEEILYPESAGEAAMLRQGTDADGYVNRTFRVTKDDFIVEQFVSRTYDFSADPQRSVLEDVRVGRVSMEAFVNQLSVRELAVLLNGYGPGLPFGGVAARDKTPTINDEEGNPIGTTTRPELGFG